MSFARIASILVLIAGLATSGLAVASAPGESPTEQADIPSGCIRAPFPTEPTGPSVRIRRGIKSTTSKATFDLALWRVPCANNAQRSVTLIKVTGASQEVYGSGYASNPFVCSSDFALSQGGMPFYISFVSEDPYSTLCNSFAVGQSKVYVVDVILSQTFDGQKAFEIGYARTLLTTVPAYLRSPAQFAVSAVLAGTGTGRITSSDGQINCGSAGGSWCSAQFDETAEVVLTATPGSDSMFAGWVEPACGTTAATTSIVVLRAVTCTARFEPGPVEPQTGFWYDPSRPAIGFGIERNGSRMMLAGYLYRDPGDGTPVWFNATGSYAVRTFSGRVEHYYGGPSFGSDGGGAPGMVAGGNLTVVFSSPTTASISWPGLATPFSLVRYQFADQAPDIAAARAEGTGSARMTVPDPATGALIARMAQSRIIVTLQPDGDARARAGALQGRMAGMGVSRVESLATVPQLIVDAPPEALEALRRDPDVVSVERDQPMFFTLRQSGPLVQADQMRWAGAIGSGRAVAIVDSGVDASHPFLGDRVIAEACFSTNYYQNANNRLISTCPNGQATQISPGAAGPCGSANCEHGTHVAGIAAGAGSDIFGVAPGAGIVSVKVATMVQVPGCPPQNCTGIVGSDVLRALDWINQNAARLGIAAVNMSLGGSELYSDYCDYLSYKPLIDALRAKGIAVVVAAGNDGQSRYVTVPACISTAIAVGSTTKSGSISSFSNIWRNRILMAPGSDILSSIPGGDFATMDGTSMAAPHVSGAFVTLRGLLPYASVEAIRDKLLATGTRDSAGLGFYRINTRDTAVALDAAARIAPETGWWWTPGAGGRGYFMETQGNQVFMASYHYRPDGSAEWEVGQGQVGFAGQIQFAMRRYVGGSSLDGAIRVPTETTGHGQVTLVFSDRRNGLIVLPDGRRQTLSRYAF
ncbi:MAG: S8 family serine peptidase [Alphaproteobacteria bacterium]|jgi:subtilisin family serine protease|nr:S8 family serine peptidase [Alphaproteobacteria bacterium]